MRDRNKKARRQNGSEQNGSERNGSEQNGNATSVSAHNVSARLGHIHTTLAPIFLIALTPNLVLVLWFTAVHCDGSWLEFGQHMAKAGPLAGLKDIWSLVHVGSPLAVSVLLAYIAWAILLQVTLPGPTVQGPVTPKGNIPVYTDNGFYCYVVTMLAFVGITVYCKSNGLASPSIVYDHFGDFLATITVFALLLCVVLCVKGLHFPSSTDSGSSGNFVFDYYWGTELYPRILGVDIKVLTNCRFGMTVWPLLVCIFTLKSYELHGFVDSMWVSSLLHVAYMTKFFWWESGYMRTIDIMVDRAGYYICWGCLCYIPGLYASTSLYLASHPVRLGWPLSLAIVAVGISSLVINYLADYQKQVVRGTDGNCLIWGRKPDIIRAKYTTDDGKERESVLLTSGWWGVSRHFHYIPELALAFCWSLPSLFTHVMPYTYFIWLCILLTHRTVRDDEKCSAKYGQYWDEYCTKVPYRMVPHVF